MLANSSLEVLWSSVERRHTARLDSTPLDLLDKSEVGDLDAAADQEQVTGLDVKVLKLVLLPHVVEGVRRITEMAQKAPAEGCPRVPLTGIRCSCHGGFGPPIP